MSRYIVTVTKLDAGSMVSGFSSLHAAWTCAEMIAFSVGGWDRVHCISEVFHEFRRKNAQSSRVAMELVLPEFSICIECRD